MHISPDLIDHNGKLFHLLDKDALDTSLKKVPNAPMSAIDMLPIDSAELSLALRETGIGSFDKDVLAQCMRPDIERLASASDKLLADEITLAINETDMGGFPEDFPWSIYCARPRLRHLGRWWYVRFGGFLTVVLGAQYM